jgi:hypothetical protein
MSYKIVKICHGPVQSRAVLAVPAIYSRIANWSAINSCAFLARWRESKSYSYTVRHRRIDLTSLLAVSARIKQVWVTRRWWRQLITDLAEGLGLKDTRVLSRVGRREANS